MPSSTPSPSSPPISPPSSDPLEILLKFDAWANATLLDICITLREDQLHERFSIGPGCVHDTMTHIIGARLRWADRIREITVRPSIEVAPGGALGKDPMVRRTPAQLKQLHQQSTVDLAHAAAESVNRGLSGALIVKLGSRKVELTRGAALVHITTHGVHHRAQVVNMLRRLGLSGAALPELSAVEWHLSDHGAETMHGRQQSAPAEAAQIPIFE